jgi:4-aminobutyrate aminotransferase
MTSKLFRGVKRLSDIVVTRAKGCEVFSQEGARYLDFTSGIGVTSTGHCHPRVVEAVQAQAANLVHGQMGIVCHEPMMDLIERLEPIVPWADSFFFSNSGAEAVEGAVRLARHATGKANIIAFQGGYHGRTQGTLALTSSGVGYRGNALGPTPAGTHFAPYPYKSAMHGFSSDASEEDLVKQSMWQLELLLKQQTQATETAAVLLEPVLGEGGYVPPPPSFLPALRDFCDSHRLLLICDEVQSGFGRTGKMFAIEHYGVTPDILIAAKGIASGYPLSAVITTSELSDRQMPGCMGGTYGGSAVSCAAALATLDVFEEERLLENVQQRGAQLMDGLRSIATRIHADKGVEMQVRGLGLMVACEFNSAQVPKGLAGAISAGCLERGMLLLPTGIFETLRFVPGLVVTEAEVEEALQIFEGALEQQLR